MPRCRSQALAVPSRVTSWSVSADQVVVQAAVIEQMRSEQASVPGGPVQIGGLAMSFRLRTDTSREERGSRKQLDNPLQPTARESWSGVVIKFPDESGR